MNLFDFDALPPEPPTKPASPRAPAVESVGELTQRIEEALGTLGRVAVEGELSRLTRAASGHVYFDLKDADARISCVVWRSRAGTALRDEPREGMQVVVHGKLDVYAPRGTYSLIVERVEPAGVGALLLKLEQLKAELRDLGWFERRRPLPALPGVVGVVTSRDGAAFQDFLRTRSLRWPLFPVRLAHAPVQGPGAAERIAAAIARLDASGVDVIVVCRGGGSLEDLWAFNERPVAAAVHAARAPVVSGVGHETDVTLCDFVADHRAHTPTDAAQLVIPDRAALEAELERAHDHLGRALDRALESRMERFARLAASRVLRDPRWIVGDRLERLATRAAALKAAARRFGDASRTRCGELAMQLERHHPAVRLERSRARTAELAARLEASAERALDARARRADVAATSLEALSPLAVLERGYSITSRATSGEPLRSAADLRSGDRLETRLADGTVLSTVEGTAGEEAT